MPESLTVASLGRPAVVVTASLPRILLRTRVRRVIRPWQSAILRAASDTPSHNRIIRSEHLYPREPGEDTRVVLDLGIVWFDVVKGSDVVAWGKSNGAELASARDMFVFSERHPRLHRTLCMPHGVGLVSRKSSDVRAEGCSCCVWWSACEDRAPQAAMRTFATTWYDLTVFLFKWTEDRRAPC